MKNIERILSGNKKFAERIVKEDPTFFDRLCNEQKPGYLWIGCSDSRVPANEVTDTDPGEMFVHRNIANLVVNSDLNVMSVLQYAVEHLEVDHIIVCGHTGCGGIKAAMSNTDYGVLNRWLGQIKEIYVRNEAELNTIANPNQKADRLTELVTVEQIYNIAKTIVIQKSWQKNRRPYIHACMYNMQNGEMRILETLSCEYTRLPEVFTVYKWD